MPEPPPHLDSYALDEWYRVAEGLNTMGVLDAIDMGSFAAYCCAYSRWCHAEEELAKLRIEGGEIATLIIKTKQGNYIQQPLIGISNVAARDMLKYAAEFGLTPSARARLGVDSGKTKKSKFNNLIG
jgi:P27 family predicted phage terminase small subunit